VEVRLLEEMGWVVVVVVMGKEMVMGKVMEMVMEMEEVLQEGEVMGKAIGLLQAVAKAMVMVKLTALLLGPPGLLLGLMRVQCWTPEKVKPLAELPCTYLHGVSMP
jgi:hypothetical protein